MAYGDKGPCFFALTGPGIITPVSDMAKTEKRNNGRLAVSVTMFLLSQSDFN